MLKTPRATSAKETEMRIRIHEMLCVTFGDQG